MCAPSPPPAPDYAAAAQEQGDANLAAGQMSNILNNPNIITPYGSQTVTSNQPDFSSYVNNYDDLASAYQAEGQGQSMNEWGMDHYIKHGQGEGRSIPGGGNFQIIDGRVVSTPTVTQTFSPEQQRLYDQQTQISDQLNNTAIDGLDRVNASMGQDFDTSGFQDVNAIDSSGFQNYSGIDLNALDPRTVEGSVGGLDSVYNAMMDRESSRFGDQRSQTEADLIARGFNPGGSGYDSRLDEVNRAENDFSLAARMAAGSEQSRLFDLESQARAQGLDEQQVQAQVNAAIRAQQANEGMALQSSDATLRDRQLQEALMLRQLPLNEINALRTGNQANLPQFQQFSGQGINAAPMMDATLAQGNFAQQNYSNATDQWAATVGGLFDLGSAAMGMPSSGVPA